jgi:energy-coupling factor transporter transmembrane protein EcfT
MNFIAKKTSHILLFITALICSGAMFHSFDDPEGPNLLIIVVFAIIIYCISLSTYLVGVSKLKKLLLSVCIQTLLALGSFLFLNSTTNIQNNTDAMTADTAVMLIKKAYPVYSDYPSDNLPIKRAEVIDTPEGWRIGMYIEGSGLPGILQANCFLVSKSGVLTETGFFHGEGPAKSISLSTCTPKE